MASDGGPGGGAPGQGGGGVDDGGAARGLKLNLYLAEAAAPAAAETEGGCTTSQPRVGSGAIGGNMASQVQRDGGVGGGTPAAAIGALAGSGGGEAVRAARVGSGPVFDALATLRGLRGVVSADENKRAMRVLDAAARQRRQDDEAASAAHRQYKQEFEAKFAADALQRREDAYAALAAARGVQRSAYDFALVEEHVRDRLWAILENYLSKFIRMSGHDPKRHPALIIHCLRGHLVDELKKGHVQEASKFFMARISGDALRNVKTPYADEGRLVSDVDAIQSAMVKGHPIEEQDARVVAEMINDYMRFHFPKIIGHPSQGTSAFCPFAIKLGLQPNGHPIFRCLLCQVVFEKGSLQEKMKTHFTGGCRGLTAHAIDLLNKIIKPSAIQEGKGSAHKRSASTLAISKSHKRPIKITNTQPLGTSASRTDFSGTEISTVDLGYALLRSLALVLSQTFSKKLETSLDIISVTTSPEVKCTEAMKGRNVLLDILLSTDVPKDLCRDLSNFFDNIISQSLQEPPLPSRQCDAQPTSLKMPETIDPQVLFNIDKSDLKASVESAGMQPGISLSAHPEASTSTQQREKILCPSNYDYLWDDVELEADNGTEEEEQAQQFP